jgi:type VI secretion system secreted protein VgrG
MGRGIPDIQVNYSASGQIELPMPISLQDTSSLIAQVANFSSASRLYELQIKDVAADLGSGGLLVEAFTAVEGLHRIDRRDVVVLSTNAHIELKQLIGRRASFGISLANGSRTQFDGLINQAALLGSEGGLARYRVRIVPWIWLLSQSRANRVWQDKTVIEIVDSIFKLYDAHSAWSWSTDATQYLAESSPRSFCAQYRESDFDFVSRLLAEEGISWRVEQHEASPSGHRIVLFADSTQVTAFPQDATDAAGNGIRFHGAHSREKQDSIQALGARQVLHAAVATVLSHDYKSNRAVAASVPTNVSIGGKRAPRLESYDSPGLYAYTDAADAERSAQRHMLAREARRQTWFARSTVRTVRPGTTFTLTQGPLPAGDDKPSRYAVLQVTSTGVNNLPKPAQESLAELFGPLPILLESLLTSQSGTKISDTYHELDSGFDYVQTVSHAEDVKAMIAQATKSGYGNYLDALVAEIRWFPVLADGTGLWQQPRATAPGSQTAIVVGANGETTASGADELYCDKLGRVRIRFHWQGAFNDGAGDSNASCWVRVAQRSAGAGMGSQFLPRIGQEVLVKFIEGDIDRPVIVGALYNGQGEGGVLPSPGGQKDATADTSVFAFATDHATSAQGNLAGGNSPVWHGASADSDGQRNAAAQWGIRTKEFGGNGYNQLVFDDTDNQGRIQLRTTQAATELNLGHLIHTADNYRGSLRGQGAELRTDAYGAIRAGRGLTFTTYPVAHNAGQREPSGDLAPGIALLKQANVLGENFNKAATTHQTVSYASYRGSTKANASAGNADAASLKALHTAVSGMLSDADMQTAFGDASDRKTAADANKLPHTTDPIIALAAKAGIGIVAGQNLQLANGDTTTLMSGQDMQFITGNQLRVHTGQAIGMLSGASQPRKRTNRHATHRGARIDRHTSTKRRHQCAGKGSGRHHQCKRTSGLGCGEEDQSVDCWRREHHD